MKMKQVLFITLLVIFKLSIHAQSWDAVGSEGFSSGEAYNQCIALNNEIPYVAYIDDAHNRKATVMKFSGTDWEPVGIEGFTNVPVSSISFAIDNGIPYLAYIDNENEKKASVMMFDDENWVYIGQADFSTANASSVNLAMYNGVPFVSFQDWAHGSKITVMKLDGSNWETVGSAGFSTCSLPNVISLAVYEGVPFVAYRDTDHSHKASVMKFNGDTWVVVGFQGFSGGTHDAYQCIAIKNGNPYVTSWDSDGKAAVYFFNGAKWSIFGNDVLSLGQATYSSITFSNDGTLYLGFSDIGNEGKVTVMKFEETNWIPLGTALSPGQASYISLAITENGKPIVAYRDDFNMRRTSVMEWNNPDGIDVTDIDSKFNIFPNPSDGIFTIEGSLLKDNNLKIEIINPVGQPVMMKKSEYLNECHFNLSGIANGIYYVKIINNREVYLKTVVINKH